MDQIYLAAPFFSPQQIRRVKKVETALKKNPTVNSFYSPLHFQKADYPKNTVPWGRQIYRLDVQRVQECQTVVAIIDMDGRDVDSGTAYELGTARQADKNIVLFRFDPTSHVNLMVAMCCNAYLTKLSDLTHYDFKECPPKAFTGKVF